MSKRMRFAMFLAAFVALNSLVLLSVTASPDGPSLGYSDTPKLPDSKWRVHDGTRPQPRVVVPGTASTPQLPGKPPGDAVVLFDGTDLSQWTGRDGKASWKIENGFMEVNGTGDIQTRKHFGDCQLHIEWATPTRIEGQSQGRGNSGVFLFGRYEIQVLDSHDNPSYPDGQAAAIYGQKPPLVNSSRPPGSWQVYDIIFQAPRFDGKTLVQKARVTVIHNGVVVHHAQEFIGSTAHQRVAEYTPHEPRGPIKLQDHQNPVRFRNIWVRKLTPYDG